MISLSSPLESACCCTRPRFFLLSAQFFASPPLGRPDGRPIFLPHQCTAQPTSQKHSRPTRRKGRRRPPSILRPFPWPPLPLLGKGVGGIFNPRRASSETPPRVFFVFLSPSSSMSHDPRGATYYPRSLHYFSLFSPLIRPLYILLIRCFYDPPIVSISLSLSLPSWFFSPLSFKTVSQ